MKYQQLKRFDLFEMMTGGILRPRRLRQSGLIRDLLAETRLTADGLIQPYFVCDGRGVCENIKGLLGIFRESVDHLIETITQDKKLGINKVMLFGVTEKKDASASYATDAENPAIRACIELKQRFGEELFFSADVCLCAYTDHGHCGIVKGNKIDNDR